MTRPYYPVSRFTRRQYRAQATMLRLLAGAVLAAIVGLALLASDFAQAAQADPVARFDGGIGVQLALLGGAPNNVNDTQPPGRPWVISDLKASVFPSGAFDIRGKGLVLAGGNNVGRSAGLTVRMRLYCGFPATPTVPSSLVSFTSTETVQLAPNGDFSLSGDLKPINPITECPNATLLILNAANNTWFAAGVPKD